MPRLSPKALTIFFALVSFAGFLDAAYLTLTHYMNATPACSILEGCELVTTSAYATVEGTVGAFWGAPVEYVIPGGISVALLGSVYYFFWFLVSVIGGAARLKKIAPLTAAGFLVSVWFLYAQFGILSAVCVYCIASAVFSSTLFLLGVGLVYSRDEISQIAS